MVTIDTIIQIEAPVQQIVLTLEEVKNAKNIWIGKDIKINDDALGYALINKIPIHKDALKGVNKDSLRLKYKENLVKIENTKKLGETLGISVEELRQIIKQE